MPPLSVAGMAEETRARCLAALDSDSLREVARLADGATGLVEQAKEPGSPALAWQDLLGRAEAHGVPEADLNVSRYLLLTKILAFSLARVAGLPVPPDVQHFLYDEFRFVAEPERNSLHCFAPGSFPLATLCREVCLERFPMGQLHVEVSGFPRSWLLRVPRRDAFSVLRQVFIGMGGRQPYYVPHNAVRRKHSVVFLESEQRRAMVRVARMLDLNPHVRGYMAMGWLQSPNLGEVSPHLSWMMDISRELVELGAVCSTVGPAPEDSGFLVGDVRRAALYRAGKWKPLQGLLLAPREAMIEWAREQTRDKGVHAAARVV
jgi:hypothetical protein